MSTNEAASTLTNSGCEKPEALRRHYLELMGIQVWEDQQPEVVEVAQPVVEGDVGSASTSKTGQAVAVPADALTQWQVLEQSVSNCTACELHQGRTRTVFGSGHQQAELLVIGEAPGREEDLQGQPFVGRAGQLLTAMLQAIGFQRDQVYIANILKCRPPDNRDPESSEIASCNVYLRQQIELIQPSAILAVGRIAAQALLQSTDTMGAMRGRIHHYQGIPLVASYHPAYLLRKPTEKRKSWQDLLMLKGILDECQ